MIKKPVATRSCTQFHSDFIDVHVVAPAVRSCRDLLISESHPTYKQLEAASVDMFEVWRAPDHIWVGRSSFLDL